MAPRRGRAWRSLAVPPPADCSAPDLTAQTHEEQMSRAPALPPLSALSLRSYVSSLDSPFFQRPGRWAPAELTQCRKKSRCKGKATENRYQASSANELSFRMLFVSLLLGWLDQFHRQAVFGRPQ